MLRSAMLVALVVLCVSSAQAQVFRVGTTGEPSVWLSGGAGYLSHGRLHDGGSQSRWDFAGGLQWLPLARAAA